MASAARKAYAGSPPGSVPVTDTFSFAFNEPFYKASDFVPREHVVPPIEAQRPIFVDNKTGTYIHYVRRKQKCKDALMVRDQKSQKKKRQKRPKQKQENNGDAIEESRY